MEPLLRPRALLFLAIGCHGKIRGELFPNRLQAEDEIELQISRLRIADWADVIPSKVSNRGLAIWRSSDEHASRTKARAECLITRDLRQDILLVNEQAR